VAQAMTLGSKGGNLGEMLNEAYLTYDFQLQNRIGFGIKIIGGGISLFTYLLIVFMIGSLALTLFKVMEDPTAIASVFHESFI
jgi:type II secretory pathway component PulF